MKPRKLLLSIPFVLLGSGYFATFSQLDVHPLLEVQLFLLPIQLGLVAYFLLWYRQPKGPATKPSPNQSLPDISNEYIN